MKRLFVAGLSYKTAPVALREQLAVPPSDHSTVGARLIREGHLSEVVLLWTCNRVEIYGVADAFDGDVVPLLSCLTERGAELAGQVYVKRDLDAIRHLFGVTSGLDSMVLGETEIANQVKAAYEKAHAAGLTGKKLNRLFQKAFETAKEVRSTTAIGKGAASVGSVAVQHAQKIFGEHLREKKIMIIGAGNMAEKCLRHLAKRGTGGVVVVNRSIEKAEELARAFGGEAVSFGRCLDAMAGVDIVITSTGCPHIILEKRDLETVMASRPSRPLVLIDIAVPRDVDPEARSIRGVHLYDIDDLQGTVNQSISHREKDLDLCWSIIGEKAAELVAYFHAADARSAGGAAERELVVH